MKNKPLGRKISSWINSPWNLVPGSVILNILFSRSIRLPLKNPRLFLDQDFRLGVLHFMQATLILYDYGIKEYQHLKDQSIKIKWIQNIFFLWHGSQNVNFPDFFLIWKNCWFLLTVAALKLKFEHVSHQNPPFFSFRRRYIPLPLFCRVPHRACRCCI